MTFTLLKLRCKRSFKPFANVGAILSKLSTHTEVVIKSASQIASTISFSLVMGEYAFTFSITFFHHCQ